MTAADHVAQLEADLAECAPGSLDALAAESMLYVFRSIVEGNVTFTHDGRDYAFNGPAKWAN